MRCRLDCPTLHSAPRTNCTMWHTTVWKSLQSSPLLSSQHVAAICCGLQHSSHLPTRGCTELEAEQKGASMQDTGDSIARAAHPTSY